MNLLRPPVVHFLFSSELLLISNLFGDELSPSKNRESTLHNISEDLRYQKHRHEKFKSSKSTEIRNFLRVLKFIRIFKTAPTFTLNAIPKLILIDGPTNFINNSSLSDPFFDVTV